MNYKFCVRIIAGVTLTVFLTAMPLYAEPPMRELKGSNKGGTVFYGESEVVEMINELSAAAVKEIETAAGEAAKAAALAALEREAVHLAEIERLRKTNRELKKRDIKIIVITGLACFVSGAIFGGIMSSEE